MNFYWVFFILLQCNFVVSSYLPCLSHQERVKKVVEREFGGSYRYEKYQHLLVLKFLKERIAFETAAEKRKEPKKPIITENLAHIYNLAQPKLPVEEPIILPFVISKRLTEQEKCDLFARLAEPKYKVKTQKDLIVDKKSLLKK